MKKITLATIMQSIEGLAISTHNGFKKLEEEMVGLKTEVVKIHNRLNIIEGARYYSHETRIEHLEDTVRTVKNKLKLK